ncbi:hypothetical protein MKX01_001274 [Papaver californicum]|nr:hypothetical protein MKX01_001274 [Papaver californicum]
MGKEKCYGFGQSLPLSITQLVEVIMKGVSHHRGQTDAIYAIWTPSDGHNSYLSTTHEDKLTPRANNWQYEGRTNWDFS